MSVGLNLLALLNPDTRAGASSGVLLGASGTPLEQGAGSFAELLKGEVGDDLKALLDDLPSAEREALLAAMAQLSMAADGKQLPPAVDQLLQELPEMPALTDEAVAFAALASAQAVVNPMAAGEVDAEAESLNRARFSLAQMLGGQRTQADESATSREQQSRLDSDTDKRSLSNDDFAGLRRKATLELNANAATNPRAAEAVLRAEPAARRGGDEAVEALRTAQPGSAAAAAALTARPVAAASQALGVSFGQSGWSEAVVDKVMWMSSRNLNSVEIRLTPAELGPLEINLQNRGQELQVQFVSQNPSVREALESQVVRLREMVGQQGLDLVDVSVGDNGARQQQEQAERQASRMAQVTGEPGTAAQRESQQASVLPLASGSDRLVDYYA